MKKIISVLLVLCLFVTLCPMVNAASEPFQCTVISDVHLRCLDAIGDLRDDAKFDEDNPYFDATIQGQMESVSEAIVRAFFAEFVASDVPVLLISGDLTDGGTVVNHNGLVAIMKDALSEAKAQGKEKKIFVINGNHDIDDDDTTKITSADDFKQCYADFGYGNALTVDKNSCSYTAELDENYRLIAVDSCVYGKDTGEISEERLSWVETQVSACKNDGKEPVIMMHHSLLYHFCLQDMMDNCEKTAEAFADWGIHTVFSGHLHANDIACAVSKKGNRIYDVMTGSLITAPCSYRTVTFSENGVDIKTDGVSQPDADYLPEGMTEEQIDLVTNHFEAYSQKFFSEGMDGWLNRYIGSAAKIAKKLKIEEGSEAYKALDAVMGCFGEALSLPLYNTAATPGDYDTLEEIAGMYGYALPASDYEKPADVVGAVIGTFFAGDEHITSTDSEIRILYSAVSAGLAYAVTEILTGCTYNESMEALFDVIDMHTQVVGLTSLGRLLMSRRVADVLAELLLSSILDSVTTDAYTPGDLNVTLDISSDSDTERTSPLSFFDRLVDYFRSLFCVLRTMLAQ